MNSPLLYSILLLAAPGFVSATSLSAIPQKTCTTSVKPTAIRINKPVYPKNEKKLGIRGKSVLEITITSSGIVFSEKVITSSGNRNLDRAALDALRYSTFTPGKCDGTSVGGKLIVNVVFS